MSPERPAEQLARLRAQFPGWTIRGVEHGADWTAQRRDGHKFDEVYAPTLDQLEDELVERGRP